jgi:hypothetical protein
MSIQNKQDTNVWDQIIAVLQINKKKLKPSLSYGQVILSVRKGRVYRIEIMESILVNTTEEAQKQEDKSNDDKALST